MNEKIAFIKKENKYNIMDSDYNILSNTWFDTFEFNSYFCVGPLDYCTVNWSEYILHDTAGVIRLCWITLFPDISFYNKYIIVNTQTKGWNFLSINGNLLSDIWFRYADYNDNSTAYAILKNGDSVKIDLNGNIIYYID